MNELISRAVRDFDLLCDKDSIIVALSGGADSVSLLHAFNSIKKKNNLTLYACHINHMIRGKEADRDEEFVTKLCDDMGIQLFVKKVDVPAIAKEQKISLELCGRNVRYSVFDELAKKLNAKVATAHTASDNLETVLYNIARGTSVSGLCGIQPVRDHIIRPLIYATRQDVESYCKKHCLQYVIDSTNLSDEYTRNKIRHGVVPVLCDINSGITDSVTRMCGNMLDIKAFIDKYSVKELNNCKNEYGYSCEKLQKLDKAVLYNVLHMIIDQAGSDAEYRHLQLVEKAIASQSTVDLSNDVCVVCKQGTLRIVRKSDSICDFEAIRIEDYSKKQYLSQSELKKINKNLLIDCIDCGIITSDTVVRTRRAGDMFTLFDRKVTKSLKKLLNELKIPAEQRDSLLVAANKNTVLWVQGIGASLQGRVTNATECAVRILI